MMCLYSTSRCPQTSTDDEVRAGYKEERDALHEEAELPLEALMALYGYVVPGGCSTLHECMC